MSDIPTLLERFRRGPELVASASDGRLRAPRKTSPPLPENGASGRSPRTSPTPNWWVRTGLRQVIAEDNPTLIAFDQDAWTKNLDYSRRKAEQSLETFRRIRAENYELLKAVPDSAWERTGNHTENGPMTLRRLLEGYAGHAESHARQLQQIRDAFQAAKLEFRRRSQLHQDAVHFGGWIGGARDLAADDQVVGAVANRLQRRGDAL